MKKFLSFVFAMACALVTSCVSTSNKSNTEIAGEYEAFKKSLPPAAYVATGMKSVDDIGAVSARLYGETYALLMEYVAATENNRYYIGLMNEVDAVKKAEGQEEAAALQKAFQNIAAADEERKAAGEEAVLPRVIEGYNAVQALKPANKIQSLIPLLAEVGKTIVRAQNLPNELKSSIKNPIQLAKALKSAKNVLGQLNNTQKMAQYIKIQYERNQAMKSYMQD